MNSQLKLIIGAIATIGSFSFIIGNAKLTYAGGCPRAQMGAIVDFAECGKLAIVGGENPASRVQFQQRAAKGVSVAIAQYRSNFLDDYAQLNREGQLIAVRYQSADTPIAYTSTSNRCPSNYGAAKALGGAIEIGQEIGQSYQQVAVSR
jgi:hypothetical protein